MQAALHLKKNILQQGRFENCIFTDSGVTLIDGDNKGTWESEKIPLPIPFREGLYSFYIESPQTSSYNVEAQFSKDGTDFSTYIFLGELRPDKQERVLHDLKKEIILNTDIIISTHPQKFMRLRVNLIRGNNSPSPTINGFTFSLSDEIFTPGKIFKDDGYFTKKTLNVPFLSQFNEKEPMNKHICLATAATMVLHYYKVISTVKETAESVYEPYYNMYGIWWRTAAFLSNRGIKTWVTYFNNWKRVTEQINKNIPVPAFITYKKGELSNAPREFTEGHAVLITGFDDKGNIICRDSASIHCDSISIYNRTEFSKAWFENAGGVGLFIEHNLT